MSWVKPVLRIFDTPKTLEFYRDWFGFTVDWEHRFKGNFPVYMQVSKNDIVFHLSEYHGNASLGAKVFIDYREDLEVYQRELFQKDYKYGKPGIEYAPWGRCMETIDPFGNKIVFCNTTNKD